MGTIITGPNPAFAQQFDRPQESPLSQIGQILALKNQLQNAPLQRQALQQQLQSGDLENQQKQQALKDQQAATAAMQEWDGKDINALAPLMIKKGASAQAVMGLKSKALEMQQTYSKIASDDATTGQKNIETRMKKNDMIGGAFSTVLQAPDADLPNAITSTAQQLAQQGLLDPQHLQMAQQIASQPPAQARQALDAMRKGMLADSQLLEQAKQKAATASDQATLQQKQAETQFYQQNGGAPGVSAEIQQQADWLKKNPGKGPSDYKLWVMKNSPTAMVMNNQLGGAKNDDALNFAAENYRQTGQLPAGFTRSPQTTSAIISRAAALDKQSGGQGVAVNKTILNANKTSLDSLQKNFDQVNAFENTALKNMDLLQQTAAKIPDLGTKFANVPIRMISGNMIGTANMAAFKTALNTAQTEAAKVLNSSNASGILSDSARHELQALVDGNATYPALKASLDTLRQDMSNRHDSYQMQIQDIQNRIKGGGQQASPSGGLSVTAPNGKVYTFKDQASADAFKQKAGIQ